ncbi:MAG: restriction endonuclease subunit S [bacterium]
MTRRTKQHQPGASTESPSADLPEGWAEAMMGDISTVIGGGTPAAHDPSNFTDRGYPWLTPADLSGFEGTYITRGRRDLTEKGLAGSSARLMPAGTVLMSSRAPIGYVAIAANELCTNQGFKNFVLAPGIEPRYVFYWLKFKRDDIEEMGSGSTFVEISGSRCKEIPITLPPLAEQKRIVAKVEELLARVNVARERLAEVPAILKRFRQSVLAAACSGRLTEDWREMHPKVVASISEIRMPDAGTLPEIPETWRWCCFSQLLTEFRNGISTKPNIDPPGHAILRISAVRAMKVYLDDFRYLASKDANVETYRLIDGDLLFTRYNGSIDLLGVCGMVRGLGDHILLYPDKLMRARVLTKLVLPEYCQIFFSEMSARRRMVGESKSSAGQQGIAGSDVKNQYFVLPSLPEQREIVRRVDRLFTLTDTIEKQVAVGTAWAEKLTQAILAKAFRGELAPQDPNDEPASVLLDRIRCDREKDAKKSKAR